jgi:acyl-CoA synthetase (AMP-forming)/AMP-acid ligase II
MNVVDHVRRAIALHADRALTVCGDEVRTYAAIDERTERLAHALADRGVRPGERVATWLVNSIRCIETDFGIAKGGFVRASINPKLTPREAEYIVADSDARVLIYDESFDDAIAEIRPRLLADLRLLRVGGAVAGADDYEAALASASSARVDVAIEPEAIYCLFYTSGTTGRPKGVMLSHRSILHVSWNLLMELGPLEVGEKILLMQAMSHGAGFFVLPYVMKGGTVIVMRDFDAEDVLDLAERHAIEIVKLVPTMLQRMLRVPGIERRMFPSLRAIVYGASPMPTEPLRRAIEVFGPRLIQIYGQSECPVTLTILTADQHRLDHPHPERLTSAGRPWATVETRIVDDEGRDVPTGATGELALRGPHLMSGYWKRPDLSQKAVPDGWLRTQDMARCDESGMIYLLGRKDEMIISGGYNVAPREVEDVLYEQSGVIEAAVVSEPDPEWGQAVVGYVVVRDAAVDLDAIVAGSKAKLGFKRPKRLHAIAEMPKNSAGKIQKKALSPALAIRSTAPQAVTP